MIGPVPTYRNKSIEQWQEEVTTFLQDLRNEVSGNAPVQLAYLMGDESAAMAGVLMYDPSTGNVVVSDGATGFKPLAFA